MAKTTFEVCMCERISMRVKYSKDKKPLMVYTAHFHLRNGFAVSLDINNVDKETEDMITTAIADKDFFRFRQTFAVLRTNTACIAAPVYADDESNSLVWIRGKSFLEQLTELNNKL